MAASRGITISPRSLLTALLVLITFFLVLTTIRDAQVAAKFDSGAQGTIAVTHRKKTAAVSLFGGNLSLGSRETVYGTFTAGRPKNMEEASSLVAMPVIVRGEALDEEGSQGVMIPLQGFERVAFTEKYDTTRPLVIDALSSLAALGLLGALWWKPLRKRQHDRRREFHGATRVSSPYVFASDNPAPEQHHDDKEAHAHE